MPNISDLGRSVKQKYPDYRDIDDAEVGRRVKAKFPGAYDDYTDTPAPTDAEEYLRKRGGTAAFAGPVQHPKAAPTVEQIDPRRRESSLDPAQGAEYQTALRHGEFIEGGAKETAAGVRDIGQGKWAKGGTRVLRGAGQVAMGTVAQPMAAVGTPVGLAAGVIGGMAAEEGVKRGAAALGAKPDTSEFLGTVAGMAIPAERLIAGARGAFRPRPTPLDVPPSFESMTPPPRPTPREGPLPPVAPPEPAPVAAGPKRPVRPTPVQMEAMGMPAGEAPPPRAISRQPRKMTPTQQARASELEKQEGLLPSEAARRVRLEDRQAKLQAQLKREQTAKFIPDKEPVPQGKEVIPQAQPEVPPAGRAPITPDDVVAATRAIEPNGMLVTNRQLAEKFPNTEPQQLQGAILEAAKRGDIVLNETSNPPGERGLTIPIGNHPDGTPKFVSGLALKAKELLKSEEGAITFPSMGGRPKPQSPGEAIAYHLIDEREAARKGTQSGFGAKLQAALRGGKRRLVDSLAPLEDTITEGEKVFGLPKQWARGFTEKVDRSLRSQSIADERFDREVGPLIRDTQNIELLDQYQIALQSMAIKHGIPEPQALVAAAQAGQLGNPRLNTGRPDNVDLAILRDIGSQVADTKTGATYFDVAKAISGFTNNLMDVGVEAGLLSRKTAAYLKKFYPYYTDMHRVFTEAEALNRAVGRGGGRGPANLTNQSVYQILHGSKREVENPLYSLAAKYRQTMRQATQNDAARAAVSSLRRIQQAAAQSGMQQTRWGNLIDRWIGNTSKIPPDLGPISFLENGRRQTYVVPSELAAAAKSLNREQLGVLERISANFVRTFKLGTTGIRPAFALANLGRDVASAFIQRDRSVDMGGVLLPPKEALGAIGEAVTAALGHGGRYAELVQRGVLGTNTFDLYRNNPARTVEQIRSYRSAPARIAYVVRHPGELIRAAENIVGRTEELTRAVNTLSVERSRRAKSGVGPMTAAQTADMEAMANQAGRKWTIDFLRGGDWRPVMQALMPYLSAGIQGTRTYTRAWQRDPVATGVRTIASVVLPTMAATLYNLSDEKRREAYFDAQESAQTGWITFFPGEPTKDKQGAWNAIKIPLDRAAAPIAQLTRQVVEHFTGANPKTAQQWFSALFSAGLGTVSPIDPDEQGSLIEKVTPQMLKAPTEIELNKDLRTGRPVNPPHLADYPPSGQAWRYNRGTSKLISRGLEKIPTPESLDKFKTPAAVEHLARGYAGPLATDALSAADYYLEKAGVLQPEDSRSKGPIPGMAETVQRFTKSQGGRLDDEAIRKYEKAKQGEAREHMDVSHEAQRLLNRLNAIADPNERLAAFDRLDLKEDDPVTGALVKLLERQGKEATGTAPTRAEALMGRENQYPKTRALMLVQELQKVKDPQKRAALFDRWATNGLLTERVQEEMAQLLAVQ